MGHGRVKVNTNILDIIRRV